MRIKVSDFGLAREADYYRDTKKTKRLPYRWMSTEAIKDFVFTTESDIVRTILDLNCSLSL